MYGTTVALNPTNFIGMDLHSNNVVVCVLQNAANQAGQLVKKVVKRKKIALSTELEELQHFLNPYCSVQHPHQNTKPECQTKSDIRVNF